MMFLIYRSNVGVVIVLCCIALLLVACPLTLPSSFPASNNPQLETTVGEVGNPSNNLFDTVLEKSETAPESSQTALTENAVANSATGNMGSAAEQQITLLPLPAHLTNQDLEISAMDWYGDLLILIPQYPELFDNSVFALQRDQILAYLDGTRTQLDAHTIHFDSGLLRLRIPRHYQGFESIVFDESRVFVTVEAGWKNSMAAYLVSGEINDGASAIRIEYDSYAEILSPTGIGNMSDEAMVIYNNQLVTLYEANGANVNKSPKAHLFGLDLTFRGTVDIPNIEYRITDATRVDQDGRFWVINTYFAGEEDKLRPLEPEPLVVAYGEGKSHRILEAVERLVELQMTDQGIELSGTPPIQLELFGSELQVMGRAIGNDITRNWEGIARLEERGFLLITDRFPETVLAFIPNPYQTGTTQ